MKILVLLEERTTNIPLLHASASALHQHDMCKHYRTLAVATALIERSTPAFIRPTAGLPLAYDRRSDLSLLILLIKLGVWGGAAPRNTDRVCSSLGSDIPRFHVLHISHAAICCLGPPIFGNCLLGMWKCFSVC